MLKSIKIRLYPTKEQSNYINRLCGSYRKVYNLCLEKKINEYKLYKNNLGLNELGKYFHNYLTKSEEFNYLNEHNTKVLKQSILNLTDAYKRFFINGNGFPKYKSKHDKQSVRFPIDTISKSNIYYDYKITLTKQLKNIKFRCSDKDNNYLTIHKNKIHSATLTKTKSDKYILSILIDNIIKPIKEPINNIIGIDIGIKNFMVCSNGQIFENIKLKQLNEKRIYKLQKKLSNKIIGSNNRNKIRLKISKIYEKINNKKINYIHNITNQLVRDNQTIVIEDLNVKGMLKNHHLSKSIQELNIYETFRQLKYKCEWYNRNFIVIDKWYPSSKLCSNCHYKYNELSLNEREWKCPQCGTIHSRDYNASINIKNEGERIVGIRYPELMLADHPTIDEPIINEMLKSSGGLKQEKLKLIET